VLPPERQSEFHVVHTLATDTNDLGVLHPLLRAMSERLGRRVRARGFAAGRLRLEATYVDYTATARAVPLSAAGLDAELWDAARRALTMANTKRLAVRSVALTLDRLMGTEAQLELWRGSGEASPLPHRTAALQRAVDRIHSRFGVRGVTRGVARPPRPSMNAAAAGMPTGAPFGGPFSGRGDPLAGRGDPLGDLDDPGSSHANHS
jgi:hypothetical protein